jgi:CheY-like chemotaxis protein
MTDLTRAPESWRVLVVEDEQDTLDILVTFLLHAGCQVAGALSGQLALGMVNTFRPNLILLDLSMPVLDGWRLHQLLRLRPSLAHIPIIAVTALVMPEDVQRIEAARFDGYISKPFRVVELLPRIQICIDAFIANALAANTGSMPKDSGQ